MYCQVPPEPPGDGGKVTILSSGTRFGYECIGREAYNAVPVMSCGLLQFDIKLDNQTLDNGTTIDTYDILVRDGKMGDIFAALFIFTQPIHGLDITIIGEVSLQTLFQSCF